MKRSVMTTVDPNALFRYADRFARRAEAKGRGTQYPMLRQAARRFYCTYDDLEAACSAYDGAGYLGIAVAMRTNSGYWEIEPRQLIEAYR